MLGALLYLRLTSLRNLLASRLRRLREPKYLAGAAVGAAWFYFSFLRQFGGTGPGARRGAAQAAAVMLPADWLPLSTALGALALLLIATVLWLALEGRASLGFTEAEVAFLFPAPVTRRALVNFKLLGTQFRLLVTALVLALFSNRWSWLGGNALTHALGWWLVLAALSLHYAGASFTLTRLGAAGLGPWPRRALVLVAVGALFGATFALRPAVARWPDLAAGDATFAPRGWADFNAGGAPRAVRDLTVAVADSAPLAWALAPLRLVVAPFLAPDGRAFLVALGPALLLLGALYAWVARSVVPFEDASLERAARRGARVAAMRTGQRSPFASARTKARAAPFPLADTGRPELAFLWKNLLSTFPVFSWRAWGSCAVIIIAGCGWLDRHPALHAWRTGLGIGALFIGGYVLLIGPQFARQDLRSDLANTDILKTYPLAGWQIVLGELLTPVAILTGGLWLILLTAALALPAATGNFAWLTPGVKTPLALVLAAVAPALCALQLLVPNAAAILFPAWFQAARTRGGGLDVMGQRLIFGAAQLLTMILALVPAALAAAAPAAAVYFTGLPPALGIVLAGAAALATLGGEVWLALRFLGARFERLDLAAELRP